MAPAGLAMGGALMAGIVVLAMGIVWIAGGIVGRDNK